MVRSKDAKLLAERIQEEFDTLHSRLDTQKHVAEAQRLGEHAREAARDFSEAIERLGAGDQMGGSAALLNGIGQLAGFASLAGPAGAVFGSVLSAVTGIIAAILEAFAPERESLEEKIDQLLTKHELKKYYTKLKSSEEAWESNGLVTLIWLANTRHLVAEAVAAGISTGAEIRSWIDRLNDERRATGKERIACFFPDGKPVQEIADGFSWEYLKTAIGHGEKLADIQVALDALKDNLGPYPEWRYLCEQVIGYMYRMYVALPALGGLVNSAGQELLAEQIAKVKDQYHEALTELAFPAKNFGTVYHVWHTDGASHYFYSMPSMGSSLMSRVGLTGSETGHWEEVSAIPDCWSFAVSSRGTIFAVTDRATVGAGRSDFVAAKGEQRADQVFIGETAGTADVIVGVTHNRGRSFSLSRFDERRGGPWEANEDEWTPNEQRWSDWHRYDVGFRILAANIDPVDDEQYRILLLALNPDDSVQLNTYFFSGGAQPMPFFRWSPGEVRACFAKAFGVREAGLTPFESCYWGGPFPCAISTAPGLLAVQFGTEVKIQSRGETDALWHLDKQLGVEDLTVYQAKFFGKQTFAASTSTGFHHRYWSAERQTHLWAHNPHFDSTAFAIVPNAMLDRMEALLADSVKPAVTD